MGDDFSPVHEAKNNISFLTVLLVSGCELLPKKQMKVFLQSWRENNKELMRMAQETTDEDLLRYFARHKEEGVRSDAAKNPNLPEDLQPKLAEDESWLVRQYMAPNRNISPSVAAKLSTDLLPEIRWVVAKILLFLMIFFWDL